MAYGFKVRDVLGNTCVLTPDIKSIISAGTVKIPTTLRPDNTFGVNIPLPGTTTYSEDDLGVLVKVRDYVVGGYSIFWIDGLEADQWPFARWLFNGGIFWTRNETTGVVSSFAEAIYHDTIYNIHPVAFWDKLGETTFNYVRLFAGLIYEIYDASASSYLEIYDLGRITTIDYVVYLRNL